jgi:hypothetical protein
VALNVVQISGCVPGRNPVGFRDDKVVLTALHGTCFIYFFNSMFHIFVSNVLAAVLLYQMSFRVGTPYPHVTWAHVMLRVQSECERWFNIEFYGPDSHLCHSGYVTWSHVELWSAHAPARLSHFCCRTHFVRRDQRDECSWSLVTQFNQNVCLVKRECAPCR